MRDSGQTLELTGGPAVQESALKVCAHVWQVFNGLNMSIFTNGKHKRKPFQDPYRSAGSKCCTHFYCMLCVNLAFIIILCCFFHMQWLEKQFLPYLDKWESSVYARTSFTKAQKNRMQEKVVSVI